MIGSHSNRPSITSSKEVIRITNNLDEGGGVVYNTLYPPLLYTPCHPQPTDLLLDTSHTMFIGSIYSPPDTIRVWKQKLKKGSPLFFFFNFEREISKKIFYWPKHTTAKLKAAQFKDTGRSMRGIFFSLFYLIILCPEYGILNNIHSPEENIICLWNIH